MRKYIDPNGEFAVMIPNEWVYKNQILNAQGFAPHSFEFYENPIGRFQISCNDISKGVIPTLIKNHNLSTQKMDTMHLLFQQTFISFASHDIYMWMAVVENKFIKCTYEYKSSKRKTKKIRAEIEKAAACIDSIVVIGPSYKSKIMSIARFDKFMAAFTAAVDLSERAYKNGAAIEIIILLANQIDALLRLALILKKQLDENTEEIDTTLIYQKETDKPILEKKVYGLALKQGIISQSLYDKMFDLYNERNKVVHRYIITDLLTKDVFDIAHKYGQLKKNIGDIVEELEQKQFISKIGIYGKGESPSGPVSKEFKIGLINSLKEKHAHWFINENIFIKEDENNN